MYVRTGPVYVLCMQPEVQATRDFVGGESPATLELCSSGRLAATQVANPTGGHATACLRPRICMVSELPQKLSAEWGN